MNGAARGGAGATSGPVDPAPGRGQVSGLRLLVANGGAPLAWLAQMSLSEPLAAQVCFPGNRPLTVPSWPSLQMALLAISGACLLAALASTLTAWSAWRATRNEAKAGPGGEGDEEKKGRERMAGNESGKKTEGPAMDKGTGNDGDQRGGNGQTMDRTADRGVGRTRFLALLGLMSSGLFVLAILFTALAALLVAPCAGAA
jgi:hypothetical protein